MNEVGEGRIRIRSQRIGSGNRQERACASRAIFKLNILDKTPLCGGDDASFYKDPVPISAIAGKI